MANQTPIIHETKVDRVMAGFMAGRSFNRFEAERQLHDHCLHSTVSTLERKHQITISRQYETVSGYQGKPTRVCRYWIALEERIRIENKRLNLPNKEAANPTDQDKENGLQMNEDDNNPKSKNGQISAESKA